ncbi:hypothetical protein BS47DRAFT_1271918, partial [Hydnum rufescens UP504]
LNFLSILHSNTAPNLSAWCTSLQEHLGSLGHLFDTKDSLVKRYSDALQSYQLLVQFAHERISNAIATSPRRSGPISEPTSGPGLTHAPSQCALHEPQSEAYNERPSAYLRSRCPICFGTLYQSPLKKHEPNVIVSIDGCFTQKQRKGRGDSPPKPAFSSPLDEEHDETSEVDVADYGDWVDEPAAEEDFVERGMKVPVSALDACHESFTAADKACQKASTAIFADTGLMALLCEHDQAI